MKAELFQDQQKALVQDFVRAQSTKEQAILERLTDSFSSGVVINSQLLLESNALLVTDASAGGVAKVTVGTGISIAPTGERIPVKTVVAFNSANPATTTDNGNGGFTLTPQSTGTQAIPLTSSTDNWVWIGYLQTIDPAVFTLAKNPPALRLFTSAGDGFQIQVTLTSDSPQFPLPNTNWVLLAKVTTGVGTVSSISMLGVNRNLFWTKSNRIGITIPTSTADRPTTYTNSETKFLDAHINSIGDGTVANTNPHGTAFSNITGTISNAQVGALAVDTPNLVDQSVTAAKLGDDSVTSHKINPADGTSGQVVTTGSGVKTGHIQDGAVSFPKLDSSLQFTINNSFGFGNSLMNQLILETTSASEISITANTLSVQGIVLTNVSKLLNITNPIGVNGLDTGTEANNTWYAIFIITNDDGSSIASLLSTALSPALPVGYTKYRRIGWVRNDNSFNFRLFFSQDNRLTYTDLFNAPGHSLTIGTPSDYLTWVSGGATIDFSNEIPPTVRLAKFIAVIFNNGNISSSSFIGYRVSSAVSYATISIGSSFSGFGGFPNGDAMSAVQAELLVTTSRTADFAVTTPSGASNISVNGYTDIA